MFEEQLKEIDELIRKVNAKTDETIRVLNETETFLNDKLVGIKTFVPISNGYFCYGKYKGKFCFYINIEEEQTPMSAVSRIDKVECARALPQLLDLMIEKMKEIIE